MSKPIPQVQKYMTYTPHTIGADQPMTQAHKMMREHRIRHLPVLAGGKIVGILSDGDLNLIETLKDVNPQEVRVEDAMTQVPLSSCRTKRSSASSRPLMPVARSPRCSTGASRSSQRVGGCDAPAGCLATAI